MTKQGGWPPTGFGGRLRALRTQAGLSQRQLADQAGCNVFTVAKLERGVQEPAWPLVLVLARALGVTCMAFTLDALPEEASAPSRGPDRPRKQSPSETAVVKKACAGRLPKRK